MSGMDLNSAVSAILSPLFLETILKGLKTLRTLSVFKTFRFFPVLGFSPIRAEKTITKSRILQPSLR